MNINKNYHQYTAVSYAGRQLLKNHSLNEYGVWRITGEDDNPGLFGSHYEPYLDTVEGHLKDVILHAVSLPRFFSWGGGGKISKIGNAIKNVSAGKS